LGIAEINGYEAAILNHYGDFLGDNTGRTGVNYKPVSAPAGIKELGIKLDLLSVKYVLSRSEFFISGFEPAYSDSGINIYRNTNALPGVFMAGSIELTGSGEHIDGFAQAGEVEITKYGPGEISVRTANTEPGFLLLSQAWYPAWQVSIDGRPGEVLKAFGTLMAVSLPPGTHAVEFIYRSRAFEAGIITSLAGVCMVGVVFIYYSRSVRRKRS